MCQSCREYCKGPHVIEAEDAKLAFAELALAGIAISVQLSGRYAILPAGNDGNCIALQANGECYLGRGLTTCDLVVCPECQGIPKEIAEAMTRRNFQRAGFNLMLAKTAA